MKIAVVDPSLFTIPYDEHLCAAMAALGHEVILYGRFLRENESILQTGYSLQPWFYPISERWLARWKRTPLLSGLKAIEHLYGMLTLLRRLRHQQVDVIHIQWSPIPWLDKWLLRFMRHVAPVVITVHDTNPFHGSATSRFQMLGQTALLNAADALIVHSQHSRSVLQDAGVADARMYVIAHGLIHHNVESTADTHAGHGLRDACSGYVHRLLLFGTVKPYKGADLLFRAVATLPESLRRQTCVMVCGELRMPRAPLDKLASDLGITSQVIWHTRRLNHAEIDAACRLATIRVFPYRDIDASGSLLQALPMGTAIVATRVGGFPEILRDSIDGLLVEQESPHALAQAIELLMCDTQLRQRLGQGALDRAASIPGWESIAEQTVALYGMLSCARAKLQT